MKPANLGRRTNGSVVILPPPDLNQPHSLSLTALNPRLYLSARPHRAQALFDFGFVQLLPTDLPPSGDPSMLDPLEANGAVFPTAPCDLYIQYALSGVTLISMHPTTCRCQVRQSSGHPRRAKRVSTRSTIGARGRQAMGRRTHPQASGHARHPKALFLP